MQQLHYPTLWKFTEDYASLHKKVKSDG